MEIPEFHKNFFLCENTQLFPEESYILHLGYPKCFIRFEGYLTDFEKYDEFEESIFEIDWFDEVPSDDEIDTLIVAAWGFLALEHITFLKSLEESEDEME